MVKKAVIFARLKRLRCRCGFRRGRCHSLELFDSVRREIAGWLWNVCCGYSHPTARIEEVVHQVKREIERIMFEEGEKLCTPSGLQFARPIIEIPRQFKYRFSYGQNMIVHTLEETKLGIASPLKSEPM